MRRGHARSREHAAQLIADGLVRLGGASGPVAAKPATAVAPGDAIVVAVPEGPQWVSRGAHKLLGALDAFGLDVTGRRALDAGASTGGFTQVLLHRGAAHVVAADVGYGQLAWALQQDPRVQVLDRTNVRDLALDVPVDLVVADLSFIPLRLVLPALRGACAPGADLLPMVKPQFEVGRERLPAGGVVRDPALREAAVLDVALAAAALGLQCVAVVASPLPGPSGNVEYFLHLRHPGGAAPSSPPDPDVVRREAGDLVRRAVAEGPS